MRHTLLGAAVLCSASTSWAAPQFVGDVPHSSTLGCQTCHTSSAGGRAWNPFGEDILVEGGANPADSPGDPADGFSGRPSDHWAAVCPDDSDGDGSTNGEELGDPDCVWTRGSPNPAVTPSNPGDPNDTPELPAEGEGEGEGGGEGDALGGCAAAQAHAPGIAALAVATLLGRRRRR